MFLASASAAAAYLPQVSLRPFFEIVFLFLCDAVFTCTFLGTFCLKPHLRRMCDICGHGDTLSRFSLLLILPPVLWSNLDCFVLVLA
jgi:hypothetical protein